MKRTIIVDDQSKAFQTCPLNGVQIKAFNGQQDDCFETLVEYLVGFSRNFDLNELKHEWK